MEGCPLVATTKQRGRTVSGRDPELVLVAVALALLAWLLVSFFLRHDGSPVGADAAVYVWWMRLAGHEGLSAIGGRSGIPALSLVLAGVTGASAEMTMASLGCVLVVVTALAGSALVRAGGAPNGVSAAAAALTGIFSTYLAAGHLSNAAFAALFLAALACTFDHRRWRGPICGLGLIGAAGLSHPDFLLPAVAIMGAAALLAWIAHERREAIALIGVAAGGVGLAALGVVTAITGARFDVDTSRDIFLLRVDQLSLLRRLYLERLAPKASGYALWAWLPLAAVGLIRRGGALGRLLIAWCAVVAVGVAVGIVRQPFPPHRVIAFAFCLPILSAFGVEAIARRLPWGRVPFVVTTISIVAAAATVTWMRAPRPLDAPVVIAAQQAASIVDPSEAGTPVIVDMPTRGSGTVAAVLRAANVIRAEVPPERIRDVFVRFPQPDPSDAEASALWTDTELQVALATEGSGSPVQEFGVGSAAPGIAPLVLGAPVTFVSTDGPRSPTTPLDVAVVAVVGVILLGLVGAGWAHAAGARGIQILERAPATGMGALILAAVLADRLGTRLAGATPASLSIVVAAVGYLAATLVERRARNHRQPTGDRGAGTTEVAPGRHPSLEAPSTA